MQAERRATMTWEGNLARGNGQVSLGSGAVQTLPMTWASRIERPDGKTSPEELIAAAHAGCYAMALTATLAQSGITPEQVQVNAVCTLSDESGAPKITTMVLNVTGKVPGMDQAGFEQVARQAEQLCPVSNALRNNVNIQLNAHLQQ